MIQVTYPHFLGDAHDRLATGGCSPAAVSWSCDLFCSKLLIRVVMATFEVKGGSIMIQFFLRAVVIVMSCRLPRQQLTPLHWRHNNLPYSCRTGHVILMTCYNSLQAISRGCSLSLHHKCTVTINRTQSTCNSDWSSLHSAANMAAVIG